MKKILVLFIGLLLIGCGTNEPVNPSCSGDSCVIGNASTLKEEYESLNGSGIDVAIKEDSDIKVLNFEGTEQFLESGTGVIYFGFPSCPWCRNILPILIDVINSNGYTLNYLNVRSISASEREVLKEILYDYLDTDDEGIKTLYVPDVYFVKDGKIVGNYLGSVDSQENPYNSLTEDQIDELKNIYLNLLQKVK